MGTSSQLQPSNVGVQKHLTYNKDNSIIGGKYDIRTNTFSLFRYFNSFTDE